MTAAEDDPKRRFFEANDRQVRRYLSRRLPDEQAVADVAQETWRALFAKWLREEHFEDPERYLFKIAHHRLCNWRRQRGRRPEDPTDLTDPDTEAARAILRNETEFDDAVVSQLDLAKALLQLPARQREALHLRFHDELAVRQVAVVMGISESGAGKAIAAGLKSLRRSPLLASYPRPEVGR